MASMSTVEHGLCDLALDGCRLTVDDVVTVARHPDTARVTLAPDAVRRMRQSNALKHQLIDTGAPIYGVTSGFGDSNTRQISRRKTEALQQGLIHFLGAGTGPHAAPEVVRATMLVRTNCLARGNSGVRPELVQLLVDCLNQDILPMVPERGSVGASGDLVPLSYLAMLVTGEGTVLHAGETKPAAVALRQANLEPLRLEAKEGLALVNGTSFMSGFAVLALYDAEELAFAADLCTAMACQVLLGNPAHFAEFLDRQKPYRGLEVSSATVRHLLAGAGGTGPGGCCVESMPADQEFRRLEHPIQDRYSVRCGPHVTGVLRDTASWVREWLTVEINSSNDNPLFDVAGQTVHNGGNFYGGHVGQAMDALKTAVASVGDLLDRQLELVVDEKFNNGLTANLVAAHEAGDWEAGLHHGFKGMQLSASALAAEALKWTMPGTSFSRSTEAHNQDKVSMGTIAARDARSVVELVREITAIHLLALCQAADLRGLDVLSKPTKLAHRYVRKVAPFVDRDRPLDREIERVAALVGSGELRSVMTEA
ncbi:HAL/PAL/TAL family ammonia-lyase [Goodfellowiella coeruleoviolacea]|uniref:Histidine ammonia-lyase n=1 Tax=Goodfellowiella coeruleoviolacea TaxID=334858 RepID=A0AAE3GD39_9PSEU|nr:aromatic amino acid ammonia-lyase [Goodfellowiella coeruleoviolacea]MCP2163948.1 histidine ammonia-lyase (EC 4.3.1.3) [Goodfellowiella coeruleoviolacea]